MTRRTDIENPNGETGLGVGGALIRRCVAGRALESNAWTCLLVAILAVWGIACDKSSTSSSGEERPGESRGEGGLEDEQPTSSEPSIEYPNGPAPTSETVLARADGLEVTFADYRNFLRESRLFASAKGGSGAAIPPERRASPQLQSRTVRSLLERALLARTARERGIEVGSEELESFVESHDKLSRWAGVFAEEAGGGETLPDGITREDLRSVVRSRILRRRLSDALVEVPEGEELWEAYRRRNERVRLAYVVLQNTPTPGAIDAFVEEESAKIREHFERHRDEYRVPKLARITVVRAPGGEGTSGRKLERAAELLAEGVAPERVAEQVGLEAAGEHYVSERERPEVFEADVGEAGVHEREPAGPHAWRLEKWKESQPPKLRGGLKREIASELLQRSIVPSVQEKLRQLRREMREVVEGGDLPIGASELEELRERLERSGFELETTEAFRWNDHGTVPGLGVARKVLERAFAATPEAPIFEEPVLSRGRAIIGLVIERERASRSTFESRREEFRRELRRRRKQGAVRRYVAEWFDEHDPSIDLTPVQVEYGVLRK